MSACGRSMVGLFLFAYSRSAVALCLFACILVGCAERDHYPEEKALVQGRMAVRELVRRIAEGEDYSDCIDSYHWRTIERNEGRFSAEADVTLLTIGPGGGTYCEYDVDLRESGTFAIVGVYVAPPRPPQIINISFCERP